MTRFRLNVMIAVACAALLTACQPSGQPGSTTEQHFIAEAWFAEGVGNPANPIITSAALATGVGLQGNFLQGFDSSSGTEFFNTRYTNFSGRLIFPGARLPARWRLTWTTGSHPPHGCNTEFKDYDINRKFPIDSFDVQTLTCVFFRTNVQGGGVDSGGEWTWTGDGDKLLPHDTLHSDEWRDSADGRFRFYYQSDGNLVLLNMAAGGSAMWHTGTNGTEPGVVRMQGDGNLVMHDAYGNWVWHSGTNDNDGAVLIVQSDGQVTIRRQDATVIWSTGTCCYW